MDLSDLHTDEPLPDEDTFGTKVCVNCGKRFDVGGLLSNCGHVICGRCNYDRWNRSVDFPDECPACGVATS